MEMFKEIKKHKRIISSKIKEFFNLCSILYLGGDFMAKRRRKKKLKLGRILIILFMLYIGFTLLNQSKLMNELKGKKEKIELEIETLQVEIDSLNEEIENSDSLQFVEKIARDELGMVKPREIIYIDKNKIKKPFLDLEKKIELIDKSGFLIYTDFRKHF